MNAFADTLLSLVFGWMRALVEGVWSFLSSGRFQNALSWLGDHWLWLVLFLCALCTVLDYLIWLVRWRPYILWRNHLRRLFGREIPPSKENDVFQYDWNQGVDVDLSDMQPAPVFPEMAYETWQPVDETADVEEAAPEMPPAFAPAEMAPAVAETPVLPDGPVVRRRRRSQRHEKKKFRLSGILPKADEEEAALLDGLPPAVNKSQAFHAPVYPGQYDNSQG